MAISMKELSSVKLKKTAGEKQGVERTQSLDPNFHILSGQAAKKGAWVDGDNSEKGNVEDNDNDRSQQH